MPPESNSLRGPLCFVGYMAGARPGYTTSQGYVLSELMRERDWPVRRVTTWHNRYLRLADVAAQLAAGSHPPGTVAVLEVYSGANFVLVDIASALAKWRGLPIVMVLHGGALPEMFRARHEWTGRVLQRAKLLVAPSEYLARAAREAHGVDVAVIPNVVSIEQYSFRLRRRVRPRLFWMRSFHTIYNPGMAIRVIRRLRQDYPEARLVMGGRHDADCASIQKMVVELGLSENVSFPGFLDQSGKNRASEDCDVFINTNRVDNMPVAVVEACAFGLPVVATAVGGVPDLLTDGESGLLVPDDDDEAMARAIRRLIEQPALAERLSQAGRELALRSSPGAIVPQWERLFRRAAEAVPR